MPFFFFRNPLGSKMKKGIRTFCNTNDSTSTLNQRYSSITTTNDENPRQSSSPTLEDLILQLELEEEIARKSKLTNHYNDGIMRGRMSCVNNSDILRSARNALDQYHPRFSLDGRDAMPRSRFGIQEGRNSVCCERSLGRRFPLEEEEEEEEEDEEKYGLLRRNNRFKKTLSLPATLAGESVVWCEPGVVAKLMGLEAMPVPVSSSRRSSESIRRKKKEKVSGTMGGQNLRRRFERHDLERRLAMEMQAYGGGTTRRNKNDYCSSRNEYFVKPVFH